MRMIRSSVLALMLSAAPAAIFVVPAQAQISVDIRVDVAPPPLPFYEQPVIPADGYLWVPGYWAWDPVAVDYYWVPGTWVEPPQRDLLWTPAYWGWNEGRYVFYPGYWGHEVGFYGGIDYGCGYNGDGYYGGRWNNGAFFYNRTVNNVENVRITNIYNETVVVHDTSTRVSFNGGNGGIAARPTPQQEAFGRERHVEATAVQRQQVETASKDRSLFSSRRRTVPEGLARSRTGKRRNLKRGRALPRRREPPSRGRATSTGKRPRKRPGPTNRAGPRKRRRSKSSQESSQGPRRSRRKPKSAGQLPSRQEPNHQEWKSRRGRRRRELKRRVRQFRKRVRRSRHDRPPRRLRDRRSPRSRRKRGANSGDARCAP